MPGKPKCMKRYDEDPEKCRDSDSGDCSQKDNRALLQKLLTKNDKGDKKGNEQNHEKSSSSIKFDAGHNCFDKSMTLKKACDTVESLSEVSELSVHSINYVACEPVSSKCEPLIPRRSTQDNCAKLLNCCEAEMGQLKDLEAFNAKLRQDICEIRAQIVEFEKQRKSKLEQQQRLQANFCELSQHLEENQQRKLRATEENRCIIAKNAKLSSDVTAVKISAQKAQKELQCTVEERMNLQRDLHEVGKCFTQTFDQLKSKILEASGTSRALRQNIAGLEADVSQGERELSQTEKALAQEKCSLEQKQACLRQARGEQLNFGEDVAKVTDDITQRLAAVKEVCQAKEAGLRLLAEVKTETEKHQLQCEVMSASLAGKEEILEFLKEEVERLRTESDQLQRTVAGKQGQFDRLQNIEETRHCEAHQNIQALQQLKQALQQLHQQYCKRAMVLADTTFNTSSSCNICL